MTKIFAITGRLFTVGRYQYKIVRSTLHICTKVTCLWIIHSITTQKTNIIFTAVKTLDLIFIDLDFVQFKFPPSYFITAFAISQLQYWGRDYYYGKYLQIWTLYIVSCIDIYGIFGCNYFKYC
jgi:hypothetical protein